MTSASSDIGFANALRDLDARVDRFVILSSQTGEDARSEKNLLYPALRAMVGQYRTQLAAAATDRADPTRRRVAAKALAFSDDPGSVAPLVACLSEKDDVVLLTNACYALSRLGSAATPPEPLVALVGHADADVRNNALVALWHVFDARRAVGASALDPIAASEAMPAFETALFDGKDPMIRANAAAAMGALGDPRAVDPLLNLLRDPHPLVRTQTALALGKLGDRKAIPALVKSIDDSPKGSPRSAVILALTALLEKERIEVPANLGDSGRLWEQFVREKFDARR